MVNMHEGVRLIPCERRFLLNRPEWFIIIIIIIISRYQFV